MKKLKTYSVSLKGRLLDFVAVSLEISKKRAKEVLDRRDVFVNGKRVWMARHELRAGDTVEVVGSDRTRQGGRAGKGSRRAPVSILFKDKWIVVVNKQPGELACGDKSTESRLARELKMPGIAAVHRLDKDTSGCLIFARSDEARREMMGLFKKREVHKQYHAIVERRIRGATRRVRQSLEGRRAVTDLEIVDANVKATHLVASIETGRTHQIRKHLAGIRHPVVGDRVYGSSNPGVDELRRAPRQMLHASVVSFTHPFTHEEIRVRASLPRDFTACLRGLKLR